MQIHSETPQWQSGVVLLLATGGLRHLAVSEYLLKGFRLGDGVRKPRDDVSAIVTVVSAAHRQPAISWGGIASRFPSIGSPRCRMSQTHYGPQLFCGACECLHVHLPLGNVTWLKRSFIAGTRVVFLLSLFFRSVCAQAQEASE